MLVPLIGFCLSAAAITNERLITRTVSIFHFSLILSLQGISTTGIMHPLPIILCLTQWYSQLPVDPRTDLTCRLSARLRLRYVPNHHSRLDCTFSPVSALLLANVDVATLHFAHFFVARPIGGLIII
ncbi:uncharacterized protein EI90DRAFT_3075566 [Cantharellus anzutake]|uniref:uncharacterized protein n=1 Tax=Cantharellus anzutake TaxID=1750568 RepID=UPI001904C0A5|nr:uncharacterized protein EI90DRAFT_3075566 [Cantharellus anzutake]KAF8324250.1 hypothetical protein EI90DRAFT_3075566 [Cantharellus anzutake]